MALIFTIPAIPLSILATPLVNHLLEPVDAALVDMLQPDFQTWSGIVSIVFLGIVVIPIATGAYLVVLAQLAEPFDLRWDAPFKRNPGLALLCSVFVVLSSILGVMLFTLALRDQADSGTVPALIVAEILSPFLGMVTALHLRATTDSHRVYARIHQSLVVTAALTLGFAGAMGLIFWHASLVEDSTVSLSSFPEMHFNGTLEYAAFLPLAGSVTPDDTSNTEQFQAPPNATMIRLEMTWAPTNSGSEELLIILEQQSDEQWRELNRNTTVSPAYLDAPLDNLGPLRYRVYPPENTIVAGQPFHMRITFT